MVLLKLGVIAVVIWNVAAMGEHHSSHREESLSRDVYIHSGQSIEISCDGEIRENIKR